MSETSRLIVEARSHILSHAGPLERMTSAARKGFKEYMETEVEAEGVTASRAWHCAHSEEFRVSFFKRLAWVGHYGVEAASKRHRATVKRGERIRDMVAMELEDLLEAEPTVKRLSMSGLCDI